MLRTLTYAATTVYCANISPKIDVRISIYKSAQQCNIHYEC